MYNYRSRYGGHQHQHRRRRGGWFPWWMIFGFIWFGSSIVRFISYQVKVITTELAALFGSWTTVYWTLGFTYGSPGAETHITLINVSLFMLAQIIFISLIILAFMLVWRRHRTLTPVQAPIPASPPVLLPPPVLPPQPILQQPVPPAQPAVTSPPTFEAPPTRRLNEDMLDR